mgnify:CR=1 FL=1
MKKDLLRDFKYSKIKELNHGQKYKLSKNFQKLSTHKQKPTKNSNELKDCVSLDSVPVAPVAVWIETADQPVAVWRVCADQPVDAVAEFHADALVFTLSGAIAAEVVQLPVWSGTASGVMAMNGAHTAGLSLPSAVLSGNALTATAAKIVTVTSPTAAL